MPLMDQINERRRDIKTDGYSMSIGEWISLYEKKEIDIHPEFQRFFRWSEDQKTALIESILLGIPLPPIFVSQRPDGVWDVIDGLQRLSTIYQLLGILKDEQGKQVEPLVLDATKYIPALSGFQWEEKTGSHSLPSEARLLIKRSKIAVSIVLRESDENAKYDLFERLNTGGSQLSAQEVRNCILVMLNRSLYQWMRKLSQYQPFVDCIALSDKSLEEGYDMELLLRYLVLSRIPLSRLSKIGDVGAFLTEEMRRIAADKQFQKVEYEDSFKQTFDVLSQTVAEGAFKRFSKEKNRHEGGFLVSQFEVVALGLGFNSKKAIPVARIAKAIQSIWSMRDYTNWQGAGITATRRLPHLIPLGRKLFKG